jgi:TRAP-type C4-dicarboxylate transport system substrate-binding protein
MIRKPTRRAFASLLAAGVAMPLVRGRAKAATSITIASLFGADKPETRIWLKIKELVDAKLPGRFDFRIVQNAALGGEKEVAEGIRLGSVQASLSTICRRSRRCRAGFPSRRCSTRRSCSATAPMCGA